MYFEVYDTGSVKELVSKADSFLEVPQFDIVIAAVKENDPTVKARKVIRNVVLYNAGSAIGLDVINVKQQYSFTASKIEPLEDIKIESTN